MPLGKLFSSFVFVCEIYSKSTLGGASITLLTEFIKVQFNQVSNVLFYQFC